MFQEFLDWYLAPWRRIGRVEFGAFLAAVSVPGFILMIFGFADGLSGWLAPLAGLMDVGKQVSGGGEAGLDALQGLAGQLQAGSSGVSDTPAATPFDWSGLVNNLLLIMLIPLCRMRLRDMGKVGKKEWVMTALFNVGPVDAFLQVFGLDIVPLGWLFGLLNFGGYTWLCIAASAPRVPAHERVPPPDPQQRPFVDDSRRQDP